MDASLVVYVTVALAWLPLAMTVWNLPLFRRFALDARSEEPISVLVPARDEAERLPRLLDDLAMQTGVELEVVVLDDASTDATAQVVRERALRDPRFRLVSGTGPPSGWNGKQFACQTLAEHARHGRLLFLDADVRLAPDAVARIAATAARSPAALISGFPRLVTNGFLERLLLPLMHFVLLGYLPLFWMRRSTWTAFGAGCGQMFVTHRTDYLRAGGHAAIRASRHDGVQLPRAYRAAGLRTDVFDASDCASVRMYGSAREVWRGLQKNADEGLGGPIAIVVWTVLLFGGAALPFVVWAAGVSPSAWPWLASSVAAGPLTRLLLSARLGQDALSALLHPIGVVLLLVTQWQARLRSACGRRVPWRDRTS